MESSHASVDATAICGAIGWQKDVAAGKFFMVSAMRTWPFARLQCVLVAASLVAGACGSDYGGDHGIDKGDPSDAGSETAVSADGAGSTGDADSSSDSTGSATDGASRNEGSLADRSTMMDGRPSGDSSRTDDPVGSDGSRIDSSVDGAGSSTDATRPTDGGSGLDVSVDVRPDTGVADGVAGDTRDAGPTGPSCGDGMKQSNEACDDGNALDFDGCSSLCTDRRACSCCVKENADPMTDSCAFIAGDAEYGRRAGTPKKVLCQEAYTCFLRSRCAYESATLMECYCGVGNVTGAGNDCIAKPARGPCITEMEDGMEVDTPLAEERIVDVAMKLNNHVYGAGLASWIAFIEVTACPADCVDTPPMWEYCPNPDLADGGADAASDAPGDAANP